MATALASTRAEGLITISVLVLPPSPPCCFLVVTAVEESGEGSDLRIEEGYWTAVDGSLLLVVVALLAIAPFPAVPRRFLVVEVVVGTAGVVWEDDRRELAPLLAAVVRKEDAAIFKASRFRSLPSCLVSTIDGSVIVVVAVASWGSSIRAVTTMVGCRACRVGGGTASIIILSTGDDFTASCCCGLALGC